MGRDFSLITLHKKNVVGLPSEAVATNLHEELRWIKTGTQQHKTKNRFGGPHGTLVIDDRQVAETSF
jgi:hypothetical protein